MDRELSQMLIQHFKEQAPNPNSKLCQVGLHGKMQEFNYGRHCTRCGFIEWSSSNDSERSNASAAAQ